LGAFGAAGLERGDRALGGYPQTVCPAAIRLFQWGLALLDTDMVIGTCTLASLDPENRRADLGFALARAYWGKGYMGEALRVLLRFGFSAMQLHRLTADTDPRNAASIRTLERLGFRREGYLREHYLLHGERQDSILYGLLRSDWEQLTSPTVYR
jgi:RimJ/RimL family protein N-acetyltransferase